MDILTVNKRNIETRLITFSNFHKSPSYNTEADSLKTIKAKIKKQVKLLEIAENKSKRLFEGKRKYELEKHVKHVEKRFEILQELK